MRALFILPGVLCAACALDWSVPVGAAIACESDADCPTGIVCSAALARCLDGSDWTFPEVDDVTIEPTTAGPGDTITATFTVSEETPTVEVWLDLTPRAPFTLLEHQGFEYELSLTLSGSEASGPHLVKAEMTDLAGNSNEVELGSVTVE